MADAFEELGRELEASVEADDAISVVAGVACHGEILWADGFGFADVATVAAATADTPYSLASITKPFTATLLAILVERGLIDLNRPANDYVGASKLVAREGGDSSATIGRLANHTAGLPMHFQFFFDDQDDRPPAFEETLARYGNLIDRPDERYVYSNLGYGILGHIIEEISQRPLAEMMRDEIFEPLGMTQSFFAPSKEQLAESAIRYDSSREGLPNYVTDHPAASEAFGSINDLLQFGLWHLSDRNEILRVESRRNMHRPLSSSPAASHYGLGWQLGEEHQGVRNFGHNGSMAGVETYVYLRPAEDVVVAAISNFPSPLVRQAFDGIYRVLGIEKGATAQTATKAPIYAPSALQGQWNGAISTYAGEFEIQMDLLAEADDVLISGEEALTNLSYGEDHVYGQIDVELDVPDATRTPHILLLNLRLRGNRLAGVATARSLPGSRPSNALSYPVELRRKSSG